MPKAPTKTPPVNKKEHETRFGLLQVPEDPIVESPKEITVTKTKGLAPSGSMNGWRSKSM